MSDNPLESLSAYSQFVTSALNRPTIERSTVSVWSTSRYTGTVEGEIFFHQGFRLRLREELDFAAGLITSYGYQVYRGSERLFWYDDFPHPNDASLGGTFPHHQHLPPDIKKNRVPAPAMSFTRPNLPTLIDEIRGLISGLD